MDVNTKKIHKERLKNIGRNIYQFRLHHNLRQGELAKMVNMNQSQVSGAEKGRYSLTQDRIIAYLVNNYDIKAGFFYDTEEERKNAFDKKFKENVDEPINDNKTSVESNLHLLDKEALLNYISMLEREIALRKENLITTDKLVESLSNAMEARQNMIEATAKGMLLSIKNLHNGIKDGKDLKEDLKMIERFADSLLTNQKIEK